MKDSEEKQVLVTFSENNSGGGWWLSLEDYTKLVEAGWEREEWSGNFGIGGGRPYQIHKKFPTLDMGVAEWEWLTGENSEEEGCSCCGQPYNFYTSEVKS